VADSSKIVYLNRDVLTNLQLGFWRVEKVIFFVVQSPLSAKTVQLGSVIVELKSLCGETSV